LEGDVSSRGFKESERGAKGEKERVILSSHAGIRDRIVDYVATSTRAILCREYMTRSTRINWHYSYDVVSPATVTRPLLPLPMTLAAFAVAPCSFLVFNTTMHNVLAILPAAGREKKRVLRPKRLLFLMNEKRTRVIEGIEWKRLHFN